MVDALLNLANFCGVEVDQVTPQMVGGSSAGVRGWAYARIDEWQERVTESHDPRGLVRDDRPPLTMAGQEALDDQDGTSQPPKPKPLCDSGEVRQKRMSIQKLVSERLAILKQRSRDIRSGVQPVGLVPIGEGRKYARDVIHERWRAEVAGRTEDRALEASAMCFGPEDKILCAATS